LLQELKLVGAGGKYLLPMEQILTTGENLLVCEQRQRHEANVTNRLTAAIYHSD